MKHTRTTTLILASLALSVPAFLSAQSPSAGSTPESATPGTVKDPFDRKMDETKHKADKTVNKASGRMHTGASGMGDVANFRRVSKASIENQTTAKDMIGKAVYGNDDEKLGDIADLTIGSALHGSGMASTTADRITGSGNSTYGSANPSATGQTGTKAGSKGTGKVAGTDGSGSWSSEKAMPDMNEPRAIISVGGLMGIGEDLVAVPLSALGYDSSKERYTLNVNKAAFVAVAENKLSSN